ncbi:PREDICTED: coagulation factor IX-like [Dinoponera quadriceps]|uniref:Coagulation factor IX-like n=1 Tax=Dinoponera quadriceps TaxID=609295 RepID=A0A6P3X7C8_DINQU|nr:PREDICTED: coagulation factor IX-like [Dinoponera quadriceps]
MMRLAILLVVGVIARQTYGDAPEAIVGGFVATAGQFPHQCSLRVYGQHICGGTIISSTHIVTAAHCVDNPSYARSMTIATGTLSSTSGTIHQVKEIKIHPGYTGEQRTAWKDDIAVIILTKPMTFNSYQKPVPLASRDYTTGTYRGITSGWGKTSVNSNISPNLKWLAVNILSKVNCLKAHNYPQTNDKHMCTLEKQGQGVCQGDSGGPLIINGELCGVTSWVAPCALGIPDVFTNVFYYLDFIKRCQLVFQVSSSIRDAGDVFEQVLFNNCMGNMHDILDMAIWQPAVIQETYGDAPEAIVGGFVATAGQFPHQCSLRVYGEHICGGTIISSTHIVTAAHCVEEKWEHPYMTVATGTLSSTSGTIHQIKEIMIHPGYTGEQRTAWKDDIAVIILTKPMTFNSYQKPVPLASRDYTTGTYRGITSGWGKTSVKSDVAPYLKWLGVNILSKVDCTKAHRYPQTNDKQMCTLKMKGHGVCQGDSGGPLIANGELCGVTSWVAPCALGIPDVFTNVYFYKDFIKQCQLY